MGKSTKRKSSGSGQSGRSKNRKVQIDQNAASSRVAGSKSGNNSWVFQMQAATPRCQHEPTHFCRREDCKMPICIDCFEAYHSEREHHVLGLSKHKLVTLSELMEKHNPAHRQKSKTDLLDEKRQIAELISNLDRVRKVVSDRDAEIDDNLRELEIVDNLWPAMDYHLTNTGVATLDTDDAIDKLEGLTEFDLELSESQKMHHSTFFKQCTDLCRDYVPSHHQYTWRPTVKKMDLYTCMASTEDFKIHGCQFRISVEIYETTTPGFGGKAACIYLHCDAPLEFSKKGKSGKWHLLTHFKITVISPVIERKEDVNFKQQLHNFCDEKMCYGWEIMSLDCLLDPANQYVQDGKLTILCEVEAWKPCFS